MSLIVFSHTHSFPAATYRDLFKDLRGRGASVKAIDKLGHDPCFPVADHWHVLVPQQLHELVPREAQGRALTQRGAARSGRRWNMLSR